MTRVGLIGETGVGGWEGDFCQGLKWTILKHGHFIHDRMLCLEVVPLGMHPQLYLSPKWWAHLPIGMMSSREEQSKGILGGRMSICVSSRRKDGTRAPGGRIVQWVP